MSKSIALSEPKINPEAWGYLKRCLDTGWVSSAGPFITKFEGAIAKYLNCRYAVATSSGTAALHLALIVAGVNCSDEVIVPTLTFIAPVNAVKYVGAEPIFMDCDDYLNIDIQKIEDFCRKGCLFKNGMLINRSSRRRIKAIIPVHIFGHPANLNALMPLAKKYNLKVIEDATESLGSHYLQGNLSGRFTGTIGELGCLSFNGNKIITTGGGGMLLTNQKNLAEMARYLSTQARDDQIRYLHRQIGYNYRLTNIQAALGIAQLRKLKPFIVIKRRNFMRYVKGIKEIPGLKLLTEPLYSRSNYWFYSLIVDKKKYGMANFELLKRLRNADIQARPIWYLNHKQKPYLKNQHYKIEKALKYYQQIINLPCSVDLEDREITRIIKIIRENAKN